MERQQWSFGAEQLKGRLNLRLVRDYFRWMVRENEKTGLLWLEYEGGRIPLPVSLLMLSLETMLWVERLEAVPDLIDENENTAIW